METGNLWFFYFLAVVVPVLGAGGDLLFKQWSIDNKPAGLAIGWAMCNLALFFLVWALKKGTLANATMIYEVVSTLIILSASRFYFQEAMTDRQYLWAIGGLVCVVMMQTHR